MNVYEMIFEYDIRSENKLFRIKTFQWHMILNLEKDVLSYPRKKYFFYAVRIKALCIEIRKG